MSTRKIQNKWYVDFRYQRKRYRIRSPINTKNGAREFENNTLTKLIKGEQIEKKETVNKDTTFNDFSEIWFEGYVKTNNGYSEIIRKRSDLNHSLIPFFGKIKIREITNQKIEEYKAFKMTKISCKTLKNQLSILKTCLRCAVDWEYLERSPLIKMPKVPQCSFRWLSEEKIKLLLNASNGLWHDMIFLAVKTGLRFGELIALEWSDFDFENKKLTISKSIVKKTLGPTKSGRIRYIPLTKSVCEYFEPRKKKDGLVFKDDDHPINQKKAYDELERLYKKAEVNKIGWHGLRHSFASHLASKGVSLLAIKELLGHANIQTTMRYAHLCPSITEEAMRMIE